MRRDLTPFRLYLLSKNRAPRTIDTYCGAVELLAKALNDSPTECVTRSDVQGFMVDLLERTSAGNAANKHRSLQQFFRWWAEEYHAVSPMEGMKPPTVPEVPVPVITEKELAQLLVVTSGSTFQDRRDHAMFRLVIDSGLRLSELMGMRVGDINLDQRCGMVLGKGRRERPVVFSAKTALAISRYLRFRTGRLKSSGRATDALWVGERGALTGSGFAQLLRRRCREAGMTELHPHQFRHTKASRFLSNGGQEGDLMRLMGWNSRTMVMRYAADTATERALAAARHQLESDTL